jgi:uncharacterized repeat protein (TIGR01451 family)
VDLDLLTVTGFTVDTNNDGFQESFSAGATATIAGVGSITLLGTGAYTFIPVANYNGTVPTITYTISDGNSATANATLKITVTPVNDAPSFTIVAVQTICANSGAQTVSGWANALSKGPADENSQTLSFVVTNDKNSLFSTQPAVDASGNLTYTLAANQSGSTIVSVNIKDDGGTANGGVDASAIQTSTITVNVCPADLQVTKTVDKSAPKIGDQVTFTLTAKNNGPGPATNIKVTDALPSGYTFVSSSTVTGAYVSGVWSFSPLVVNGTATLTIVATVK